MGAINNEEKEVGSGDFFECTGNAFALDFSGGISAEAGGVGNLNGVGTDEEAFLNEVARGAGLGADDGAGAAKEGVEEAGFTGVGWTGDDSMDPFAQDGAVAGGGKEGGNVDGEGGQAGARAGGVFGRKVFLGEIYVSLDFGLDLEKGVGKVEDAAAEFTVKLTTGGTEGALRAGTDEVSNGLGLGEVELAVGESGAGEFAGFRRSAATGKEVIEDTLDDEGIAVAGDFEEVFAGVRSGS